MSEPGLPRETVLEVLRAVGDRGVLVGGQAVAWWAEHYIRRGRLGEIDPGALYVSRDADFAPKSLERDDVRALTQDVARKLGGRSSTSFPWSSLIVGSVTFRDSDEHERTVEFLRDVHGVQARGTILETAVRFESEASLPTVYVMEPILLLETRVANVADLERYRAPKGVLQARLARDVAREWLRDGLDEEGWDGVRADVERVLTLAEGRSGVCVAAHNGVDVLAAVPHEHEALPLLFRTEPLRRCRERVAEATAEVRAST